MLKYLRKDIKKFANYQVLGSEPLIKLDANEGLKREDGLNFYPPDRGDYLRERLGCFLSQDPNKIILGNGSSELLDIVFKAYLEQRESVVSIWPTFAMYHQYTVVHKGIYREFPLQDFQHLNVSSFLSFVDQIRPKLIIICNPNNPTGSLFFRDDLIKIIRSVDAMVVVDEAYIEFTDRLEENCLIPLTEDFGNLIVLLTFSKAVGLAGIRLGYALAQLETIECLHRVRSPYNVGTLTQMAALNALNEGILEHTPELIKIERERMRKFLLSKGVKPLPSQTNFLFFEAPDEIYKSLVAKGIQIRKFAGNLGGYYRLTIGDVEQNNAVIKVLKEIYYV